MGLLVAGKWRDTWYSTEETDGAFVRPAAAFRGLVSDHPGTDFPPAPNRYHLYVSLACPWATRAVIFRKLKRLEDVISMTVLDPLMGEGGWRFSDAPRCQPDPINGAAFLRDIYLRARPDYSGRVTVPVLWDIQRNTIVNNESADIIRMLNSTFDQWGDPSVDFYPRALRAEIDEINLRVYATVNNGVYRAGFATTQRAYDAAVRELFDSLDWLEGRLSRRRYLVGDRITEADWRLFSTLVRFDAVYHGHFKCNLRRLVDYPNLWGYTRELYQVPGIAELIDFDHIKRHYYGSHPTINPTGIIPAGPVMDFTAPHHRELVGPNGATSQ